MAPVKTVRRSVQDVSYCLPGFGAIDVPVLKMVVEDLSSNFLRDLRRLRVRVCEFSRLPVWNFTHAGSNFKTVKNAPQAGTENRLRREAVVSTGGPRTPTISLALQSAWELLLSSSATLQSAFHL